MIKEHSRIQSLKRLSFLRLGDWFAKYELLLVSILILSIQAHQDYTAAILATVGFSITGFSFAFGLNYFVEREADEQVGKNRVRGLKETSVRMLLLSLCLVMFAIPLLTANLAAFLIAAAYFVAAIAYSVKPSYLKSRGISGILICALSLQVLPFLFFVSLTGFDDVRLIIYLSWWLFLHTAKRGLFHQIRDYENDRTVNMNTFAVALGRSTTVRVCKGLVWVTFAWGCASLLLFKAQLNILLFLLVLLSNENYRAPEQ